jgi:hypothetical protein
MPFTTTYFRLRVFINPNVMVEIKKVNPLNATVMA